jgi:sugar O-acyltransferase (sialic acid O-acetyltransferase NeuD family)
LSDVLIFGIGDYGRIAHHYLSRDSEHDVIGFTVHGEYADREELNGLPVIPYEDLAAKHAPGDVKLLVAAGFSKVNQVRADIYQECKAAGYEFVSYVSSQAMVWPDVPIGENTFIFEANVVQPGVAIGDNCVLWSGNHIGHDTTIGNHVFIASHAVVSGNCTIQDNCFVGVNATFRDGVTVAPKCVIGAGALVMKDTEEGDVLSVPGSKPYKLKSWELRGF